MAPPLLVSTRKGLFVVERGALGWDPGQLRFAGKNVSLAVGDARDGTWYAALQHRDRGASLHRSEDLGRTWREVGAPDLPGSAPSAIWALAPDPAVPGAIWCGTIPAGLFHSADRGRTWRLVRGLWDRPERAHWVGCGAGAPGLHSICVDPRDPRVLTVAISAGGIWHTRDHGAHWELGGRGIDARRRGKGTADAATTNPHLVVQCAGDPDRMWCQHHAGIFVSDDAGARWRAVRGLRDAFGFAVAVHPTRPDTAWFVPAEERAVRVAAGARLAVQETRDGGRTFVRRASGLPRPAWDLVLRHALDVDAGGRILALGSSTGGLWVSENAGARFECVGAHLPPIHAVRFAPPPLAPRRTPTRKGG